MEVTCPKCGEQGYIPPAQLLAMYDEQAVRVTCPTCKHRFPLPNKDD